MTLPTGLAECLTPDEIFSTYLNLCQPHGGAADIRLFCHRDHPHEAFCMVRMSSGASAAAQAIGGQQTGDTICKFHPLPSAFRCQGRHENELIRTSCDNCYRVIKDDAPKSAEKT